MTSLHYVRFTKFWARLSVQEMGERAAALGYDGLDLAVRPGHAINVSNAMAVLPDAVRGWRELGVACSMITADVSLTDAMVEAARTLFRAAADSGVPRIKLGYFQYEPGSDFETAWSAARTSLAGFEALARETGVQAMVHSHGGLCLGSTCAGLRHLLNGFDPALIGAYPDLGHLAIGGEDPRVGLAMLRGSLAAVAAKDARHVPDPRPDARAPFAPAYVPLGEGAAPIADAVRLLREWAFTGPISVHTEYTTDQTVVDTVGGADEGEAAARLRDKGEVDDLKFLRGLCAN